MELPRSFLIHTLFLLTFTFSYPQPAISIPHNNITDVESLLAFKSGVVDPYGILGANWTTDASFCSWIGVHCGHKYQRVVALALGSFNLQGTISPYLGNLSFLSYLSLGNNSLVGPIPDSIGRLSRLESLWLQNNTLSGAIPLSFFNLSSLVNASFYTNSLSGPLPTDDDVYMLLQLERISLAYNQLTGKLPLGFVRCSKLQILSLYGNGFSGSVPDALGNITGLTELDLGSNQLTGTIPTFIGNLSNLITFDVDRNYLEGSIPGELGNLAKLQYLYLSVNNLTGPIPLALLNASMINILELSTNKLSGTIPATVGNSLHLLTILNLETNQLTGGLDFITSLSNCRALHLLDMASNGIEGVLQDNVGNLSANIQYFYIQKNHIKGKIPAGFGNLSSLLGLNMRYNELTGELPSALAKLNRLQAVDLGHNRLNHLIPKELGELASLSYLYLDRNNLSGSIPDSVGNMSKLQHLSLTSNRLFSSIPRSLWSLRSLIELQLAENSLTGSLPPELSNLNALDTLDLSENQLSGNITSGLGELQMLVYIDLSDNSFHGDIPQSLGGLVNVKYLNLSYNFLTGSIPKSLANLRYLGNLDLSYNNLEGQIPEGRVFSNISIPSLKGNTALCGAYQLGFSPCSTDADSSNSRSKVYLLKYILPPIGAIVVLLSCLYFLLLFRRRSNEVGTPPKDTVLNDLRAISYNELVRATNNFSDTNLLGKGSVSSVFKACLDDGTIVAVKVLNLEVQGALKSFDAECYALSMIRHRNLVKIISTCSNMDFKALVLQFMPNGSLEKWLHSHDFYLNLLQRINIMVDVALALEYLHHHHPHVVVHRDLKPSNVLLDEDMNVRVADFGIAKLLLGDGQSLQSASAPGTIGYMAPEYGFAGKVSREGDVYSFGILLLETLTGKRPSDPMFGGELSLREWVSRAYPDAVSEIVDCNLLTDESIPQQRSKFLTDVQQCLSSMVELGLSCSRDAPKDRILMRDVVPILQKIKMEYSSMLPSD